MPDAIELLSTRSSFKAVELKGPGPSAAEIDKLLSIARRVPDHGKLAPWRFIVFEGDARLAAGSAIATVFRAKYPDAKPENVEFERRRLAHAPLVIAVSQPCRPPRENSGMGASPIRRSRGYEPCPRSACARIWCELDHRLVRL
jgi:nitroreductase